MAEVDYKQLEKPLLVQRLKIQTQRADRAF